MKIKVVNFFKLTSPDKNILDIEIVEGEFLTKGMKFRNSENNLEFVIDSIGHVNPPISKYYSLLVNTIKDDIDLSKYRDKVFINE